MRDVCVIGAGIVGASVAFQLSRIDGIRVSILDAGYPGAGTTEAGTGWISARPGEDAGYRQLRLAAMEEHLRLTELFPAPDWLTLGGTLRTEDAGGDFDALIADSDAAGYPVEVLTAAEVNARLEPNVVFSRPELRLAHFTSEFTIAGSLLARTLFTAAVDNGAIAHLGTRVVGLEQLPSGRHRVVLEDGTALEADAVVNAAGARADQIAELYDIAMPLLPQPGISIQVKAEGNPLRRFVSTKEIGIKPETDGVIRLRAHAGWSTGSGATDRVDGFTGGLGRNEFVAHVVAQAEQLLPSLGRIHPIATRAGVRPFPADGRPRIGEVATVPGYFDAVMHSGAVLAPLVGRLLAEEIASGESHSALAAYRPARFLDTTPSPGQAVGVDR